MSDDGVCWCWPELAPSIRWLLDLKLTHLLQTWPSPWRRPWWSPPWSPWSPWKRQQWRPRLWRRRRWARLQKASSQRWWSSRATRRRLHLASPRRILWRTSEAKLWPSARMLLARRPTSTSPPGPQRVRRPGRSWASRAFVPLVAKRLRARHFTPRPRPSLKHEMICSDKSRLAW